jgi:hypothetical protein
MTVSKEQAMAMFDHDLNGFMNEVRGLLSHYRIGDWEAYLFFRKPDYPGSYVLKYEATAGGEFAEKIVSLHTEPTEDNRVTPAHECRECGQECDCAADTCCHPDTAECGVSQNFEEQSQ